MNKKILYLANAYGFSPHTNKLLDEFIFILEAMNIEVWEPFRRNNESIDFNNPDWIYKVGHSNFNDIREADGILGIVNGTPPDEGVMIELGFAYGLGKTIFLYRDDIRISSDSVWFPLNLMIGTIIAGEIESKYYTALEDLTNKNKALYNWAN